MSTWRIKTEQDRQQVLKIIQHRQLPCTVEIVKGLKASTDQERLARKWHKEAEAQGDQTAEEYRAYCKLHFGVGIMKQESELYAEAYDRIIRPLPYEHKLAMMAEPLDFPVTRGMSTGGKKKYLDSVWNYYTGQGFALTDPDRQGQQERAA